MLICFHRIDKNVKYGIITLIIYAFNRFFLKKINIPVFGYILKNHFNDFLGGFLFCCYVNAILVYTNRKQITKFWLLILFMLPVSISWEFVFPLFLKYSTSDIFDVICYLFGTITYYFVMKFTIKKTR